MLRNALAKNYARLDTLLAQIEPQKGGNPQ